jgi:hypothetical protein
MYKLKLFEDKKWLEESTADPNYITITGRPGNEIYDIENENNEWIEHINRIDDKYFAVDDWGGDTDLMSYEEIINFIKENFDSITEIKLCNKNEGDEAIKDRDDYALFFSLQLLNDSSKADEYFDKCKYCSHYIYKGVGYCNKYCLKAANKI